MVGGRKGERRRMGRRQKGRHRGKVTWVQGWVCVEKEGADRGWEEREGRNEVLVSGRSHIIFVETRRRDGRKHVRVKLVFFNVRMLKLFGSTYGSVPNTRSINRNSNQNTNK